MALIEFAGQSSRNDTSPAAATSRLLNLYREAVQDGDQTQHILRPVPGQELIVQPGRRFLRDMAVIDGVVYYALGGGLYKLVSGTPSLLDSISDTADTTISGNTGKVTVCAGGIYYVFSGASYTTPTGAFSDFGSVETVGQYTVLTERNGRRIQWSDIADPGTLDALNFATTESRDDNNIRGVALNGNYWVFKERSIEIWYETGDSSAAFARVGGGVIDTGLKAFGLVTKIRGALFFIGNDGIAYITAGNGMQPVSTRAVERSIRENDPTHCSYYEHEGHKFCVIRFSDRPAWVYDFAANEWHERSEGVNHDAWDAVATVQDADGTWLVGGELGGVSRFVNAPEDKGGFLYRRAVSRTLYNDARRFRLAEFEMLTSPGWATGEAAIMLEFSRDRGATFGNERTFQLGGQGDYSQRILARSLGQFRNLTVRLDVAHGHEIPLFAAARVRLA